MKKTIKPKKPVPNRCGLCGNIMDTGIYVPMKNNLVQWVCNNCDSRLRTLSAEVAELSRLRKRIQELEQENRILKNKLYPLFSEDNDYDSNCNEYSDWY